MLVGGVYSGRELSLLCPLGWVDWDWDVLSWMRVEMGWVDLGWVDLGWVGVGGNISVTGVLPRGDSSFSCQLAFRLCAFTKLQSTQKHNILEVDLCTRNTCT